MRIGELAARSGVTPDTIRYYERRGLLRPVARTSGGYRVYEDEALDRLAFIRKAQALGMSLDEVGEIIRAATREGSPCPKVRRMLRARIDEIDTRIRELAALREGLARALEEGFTPAGAHVCAIVESAVVEGAPDAPRPVTPSAGRRGRL